MKTLEMLNGKNNSFGKPINVPGSTRCRWVIDEEKARASFNKASLDAAGAVRWNSNASVPPEDIVDTWGALGLLTAAQVETSAAARERDLDRFVRAYRANPPRFTAEQRAEMRRELGGGPIIDVITGRRVA